MSTVLYRKYRARTFSDVLGQDTTVSILKSAIKSGKVGHAYLFAGPRGTGKTSMARLLTKAVNQTDFSEKGEIDPESEVSKAIEEGSYLDLIEIDAASNRGIEEIRSLKEKVNFLPTQGKYKVYIIDEVHMLTREAFNALLKTLEEPPSHAIFVLATTEPHKLPITILSRVQRFNFKLATQEELEAKLRKIAEGEELKIDAKAVELIFRSSGGSFRDAESLLEKMLSQGKSQISLEYAQEVMGLVAEDEVEDFVRKYKESNSNDLLEKISHISKQGINLEQFIKQIIEYLRANVINNPGKVDVVEIKLISALIELLAKLKRVDDAQLLLEVFVVESLVGKSSVAVQATPPKRVVQEASRPESVKQAPEKTKENVKPTKENNASVNTNSEKDKSEILLRAKKKDFRLWTILRMVGIEFDTKSNVVHVSVLGKKTQSDVIELGLESLLKDYFQGAYSASNVVIEYAVKSVEKSKQSEAKPSIEDTKSENNVASPLSHGSNSNAKMVEEMF